MARVKLATVSLGGVALVLFAAAAACEFQYQQYPVQLAGFTPLRVPMAARESVRASFTAVWSEPHYVALVFPSAVDPEMAALLSQAESTIGRVRENAVQFDFDWRVLEGAIEVGRGSGRVGPTGGFGSGEHGLVFGEFPAVARHMYQLEARPGTAFEPWARANPVIEVGVNVPGPSIGLPWVKDFSRPIAIVLALLGLAFLAGAVWSTTK